MSMADTSVEPLFNDDLRMFVAPFHDDLRPSVAPLNDDDLRNGAMTLGQVSKKVTTLDLVKERQWGPELVLALCDNGPKKTNEMSHVQAQPGQ